ncbi:MAG TPA: alpha/beta fold hydrolase [Solirubrobacteraceae bacterium]|nr:alpha/beta fold hydrolase [Solirubrobacteraceae bacterium]
MATPSWTPEPPFEMPPARTLLVPGRGELFLRDTGGDGPAVMLLHGWMASADLNWFAAYQDLIDAGYRVLAIDHRGHGRGLRPLTRFRLTDCATDAAEALRALGVAPALVVGYSMGGAIAQLIARDHPDVVAGMVLSGTAQHFQDPQTRRTWRAMGVLWLGLSLAPGTIWRWGFRRAGLPENERTVWVQSELLRHSARDLAEAGRELSRFDSRPWLGSVSPRIAVVITTRDEAVSPSKQRELAAAAGGPVFEAPIRHMEIVSRGAQYNPALLQALDALRTREDVQAA